MIWSKQQRRKLVFFLFVYGQLAILGLALLHSGQTEIPPAGGWGLGLCPCLLSR